MTTFEVGDFVRNKIHGYISMLYYSYTHAQIDKVPYIGWNALIVQPVDTANWANDFVRVGVLREELESELDRVLATTLLISKAKEYLDKLNSSNILDNLSYVEILHKLNEQEKELIKNEHDR